ncbi:hypothetical protein F1528_01625 [Yersinia pestis]|nr:hypothetical protein F1528_01625 [Yersinia pestis]
MTVVTAIYQLGFLSKGDKFFLHLSLVRAVYDSPNIQSRYSIFIENLFLISSKCITNNVIIIINHIYESHNDIN